MNSLFSGTVYKKSVNSHITTWESWLLRLGWRLQFDEESAKEHQPEVHQPKEHQPKEHYMYKHNNLPMIQN